MSDNITMPQSGIDIIPKQTEPAVIMPQTCPEKKLIVGVIEMKNRQFLNMAWKIIKTYAKEIADSSLGEYDESRVYLELLDGYSTLFMFYLDNTQNITLENMQEIFITKHLGTQTPEKDFVGYVIVKYDAIGKTMHTWQVYIKDEYRNNKQIVEIAIKFLEGHALDIGLSYSTFASTRQGMGGIAKSLGYSETFTIYRKQVKK